MTLRLVPKPPPQPAAEVRKRLRQARPDGELMCPRCAGRTYITIVTGAKIKQGRVTGGTATEKYACLHCWQRGGSVSMLPPLIERLK